MLDLNALTPDQLRSLKGQLDQLPDRGGRSPFRPRQLHDLTTRPAADNPRPLFIWSADAPLDYVPSSKLYPRLMWAPADAQGLQAEITVWNTTEEAHFLSDGYQVAPPELAALHPIDAIQAQFAQLSPEDQQMMLEAQREDKINRLRDKLAQLSDADIERLTMSVEPSKQRKKA